MKFALFALLAVVLLAGCGTTGPPKTQTEGGSAVVERSGSGSFRLRIDQPSNPDESAVVEISLPSGEKIRAGTGSSRKDTFAGLAITIDQYRIFSYVGAGVFVLGIALIIASFWFPLIPKFAGVLVMIGGALTAYMSTAIPKYAPYALALGVIGCLLWYYHQNAGKRDPRDFEPKRKSSKLTTPIDK